MALGTYAVTLDNVVIEIIQFDVLSGERIPVENATLIKVNELLPEIGQVWDGEKFN